MPMTKGRGMERTASGEPSRRMKPDQNKVMQNSMEKAPLKGATYTGKR